MKVETLEILRCPYCGGELEPVESLPHERDGGEITNGVLGCDCCTFPVVAGIPVLHLRPEAVTAREAVEARDHEGALRALVAPDDVESAARFVEASRRPTATYRELVDTLGPGFEGGYFMYRFTDPTYLVASAVVRAVAGTVLRDGGRAIDLCGGSGHLTRVLSPLSKPAPVVADLWFAKLWMAGRFVAPGCEPVCCDANAPLPFARGAFSFAVCGDALMFIWTKRQFVGEMLRLIDREGPSAAVVSHAHNERVWSPSHGQPLSHLGYRRLFESMEPRVFAERGLLEDLVAGEALDLSRRDGADTLDADPALTLVASRSEAVFGVHPLAGATAAPGILRLNPLYETEEEGAGARLRLRFPSSDYEDEFGACREYLAEEVALEGATLAALAEGRRSPEVLDLLRRRVVLELPERYY